MRKIILVTIVVVAVRCWGTQYYVSNSGSDGNAGTSTATPWQTLAHVNGQTFNPGDAIYLQRGGVWVEQLIPPSSGAAGNGISFDAYGTGAAPVITAASAIPFVSGSWTYVSGSVWKATVTATSATPTVNNVQFGKLWGNRKTGSCTAVIAGKYDWCYMWSSPNLYLYVWSPAGTFPTATYATDGAIVPILAQGAGLEMIYVNGKTFLTFQHIRVQAFDYVGVGVAGASDNLVFANMEADGMVPYGTTPLGFYVNASSPPTSIQFLNDTANLNYDGFRFDGSAVAIAVTNCLGYGNREAGLRDNTGRVTYSYSHFYGNNVAQLAAGDVVGGIAGNGNVSSQLAPAVGNFNVYPARFSFTVDDVGLSPGTEAYINTFLMMLSGRGMKFNAAVVPSYTVDWTSVNNWYAAGNEIDSHSWSHQYYSTNTNPQNATPYPNAAAIDIQYTGSGTGATLTISGNMLTTSVTDAASDNLSVNLASAPYNTESGLLAYLAAQAHYVAVTDPGGSNVSQDGIGPVVRPNTKSVDLLNVSNQDIKTASFALAYDQTKLEPDEMASSKAALQANVPGLTESFYVYPAGIEDPTTEADAMAAGYTAARGSLAMKDQTNQTLGANSLYANGVNAQNITSLAAIQFHERTQAQIDQMVSNLIFRAALWGAPYGLFTHYNTRGDSTPDISNAELGWILDSITAHGGTVMSNTSLASAVMAAVNFSGTTRWVQNPTGAAANLAVSGAGSPTVGAGTVTAYPVDLNGVNRAVEGTWDIGASNFASQRYGSGGGSGTWKVW